MAKIVFVAHGMTSPLNAALELCRRLTEAGHEVAFMSHADIGRQVAAHGFEFVRLTSDETIRRGPTASASRNPLIRLRDMRRARGRSISSKEIEKAVTDLDPELLLIDIEMHYAVIATAHLRIPTILAMNWFSVFRLPGLPPLNSSVLPDAGVRDQRFRWAWTRVRIEALGARVRHKLGKGGAGDLLRPVTYGTIHHADLKAVADARGYSLKENTDRNQWLRPYMYTELPILCFNALEFEFPHRPHPNLRYVGPMVKRQRPEARIDPESRLRWETYKSSRRERGDTRPLVYCSLGSYWSEPAFLRMVLATFARRPEWDLVLGLGGQVTEEELGPIPPNAVVLDWAPQLEVLDLADCAINHGGITSINECISSDVPMVVYSPSLLDQDGCAARIEYHRLGVRAEWDTAKPELLEQHVARVLADQEILENVRAMRSVFEAYATGRVAEGVIEEQLLARQAGS